MNAAIVGGGITGLSIAYLLSSKGDKVTLFEKSPRLGGLLGSFRIGNVWLEKYFHHIFLSDTSIRRVISEIGLEKDLFWKVTPMGFYTHGKIFPFDQPLDLLQFSALSFMDRLRFGFRIWKTGHMRHGIELDSITVKEWVERTWGGQIYEKFWLPLMQGKFGEAADQISAAWLWGRIYARSNSRRSGKEKLGYLRGGFVRIFEAMGEKAKSNGVILKLHSEVSEIGRTKEDKWKIISNHESSLFDVVILATPSPIAIDLCPQMPLDEKTAHSKIRYQGILCMPIIMTKPLSSIYWLNVGDRSIPFTGMIEQTNFIPNQDYGNQFVTYLFNYLPIDHPWMKESKKVVFERYEQGLKTIFPSYSRDQIHNIMIFRDQYATPIYDVEYLKKMPPMASSLKGLYYANTAHIFPHDRNMNFSIELAERVVKKIKEFKKLHT